MPGESYGGLGRDPPQAQFEFPFMTIGYIFRKPRVVTKELRRCKIASSRQQSKIQTYVPVPPMTNTIP